MSSKPAKPREATSYTAGTHVQIDTRGDFKPLDFLTGRVVRYENNAVLIRMDSPVKIYGKAESTAWVRDYEITEVQRG